MRIISVKIGGVPAKKCKAKDCEWWSNYDYCLEHPRGLVH